MSEFDLWLHEVDMIVSKAVGMSVHDLPDLPFRDSFDSGDSPEEFASEYFGINDGVLTDPDVFEDLMF